MYMSATDDIKSSRSWLSCVESYRIEYYRESLRIIIQSKNFPITSINPLDCVAN